MISGGVWIAGHMTGGGEIYMCQRCHVCVRHPGFACPECGLNMVGITDERGEMARLADVVVDAEEARLE